MPRGRERAGVELHADTLRSAACLSGCALRFKSHVRSTSATTLPVSPVTGGHVTGVRGFASDTSVDSSVPAAERFTLANWGLLGFAMLSSPTAGEALHVALRTLQIGNRFIDITAGFTQSSARITFRHKHLPPDVRDFLLERDIVIVFGVIVLRCMSPQLLDRLGDSRLELALPGDRAAKMTDGMSAMLADLAHNPMRHFRFTADRPATELTFPLDLLAEPMAMPDPATAALCEQHCLDLVQNRLNRGQLATRVRAILLQEIRAATTAGEIAARLNMDGRTMRRRLAEEGITFRTLQEETRCALAIDMLDVLDLTVTETATRLGYTSSAAFSRSFTRWTGVPPSAYRRS